jgi:hypothetical protein
MKTYFIIVFSASLFSSNQLYAQSDKEKMIVENHTLWLNAAALTSGKVKIAANTTAILDATAYVMDTLELNEGSKMIFVPGIISSQISVNWLILNGNSTIDLSTGGNVYIPAPLPKPTPSQVRPDQNSPHKGTTGEKGNPGVAGPNGVNLKFFIGNLYTNGSLWIRTDGTKGGYGGRGGDGGKGSSGPKTAFNNPNGGTGGDGGDGGDGGNGGNTSIVKVKIGNSVITPSQQPEFAPTKRPTFPDLKGIVISGAPGDGGDSGLPGWGGFGGEGHKGSGPFTTDSFTGGRGAAGSQGSKGKPGVFSN